MKLEQQVCSLELAKKLKELGVKQDGCFFWSQSLKLDGKPWFVFQHAGPIDVEKDEYSAFTVAELGKLIRNQDWFEVWADFLSHEVRVWLTSPESDPDYPAPQEDRTFVAETEADARALTLIYLIEEWKIQYPFQ